MDKSQVYASLCEQLRALLAGEYDPIANMANTSALLYHALADVNWLGFYLFHHDELILGPFQGKPACMHIPYGKGVCGTCIKQETMIRVDDVHAFAGHIACDAASRSEIVFPLYRRHALFGVLDIDSPLPSRFDEKDEAGLRELKRILEASWE